MDNILIVSDFPDIQYKKDSGTPAFRLIVEALSKKYIVHIIAPEGIAQSDDNLIYHRIRYNSFFPNYFRLFRIINSKLFWCNFTWRSFNLARKLNLKYNFKFVYGAGCVSVSTVAGIGKILGVSSVGRLFGTYLYPFLDRPISLFLRFEESLAFKSNCTKFIITNDGTGGDSVANYFGLPKDKLYFWRNGVDCPPVCNSQSDKIRIISMARLDGWKHVDRIVTAFTYAALKNDGIILDIVGGGPEEDTLKKLVHQNNIDSRVIFHGEICRDEALQLLGCADIFMSTNDYSNISNSLMEAMSGGKAIIVLNTGKTSDMIDDKNGILVDNEINLGDAILMLCDKEKRTLMGSKAQQYADEHFETWESRIIKEVKICEELIGREI